MKIIDLNEKYNKTFFCCLEDWSDEMKEAGYHQAMWNGTDNQNNPVSSGLYFYQLKTETFSQIRKMLMLK